MLCKDFLQCSLILNEYHYLVRYQKGLY
jgi:hypothetical protein